MNKILFTVIISFIAALLIIAVIFISKNEVKKSETEKLKIAATIFPVYDIARNVAGDKAEIKLILPPGASPHTFELTPTQVKELENTKVIFAIGHNVDNWIEDIKGNIQDVKIVLVDSDIDLIKNEENHGHEEGNEHSHGDENPHYWLSIKNAKKITENIKNELVKVDPDNKKVYEENARNYEEKLNSLDEYIGESLKDIKSRKIITFHDAWPYFTNEYGLSIVATFEPFPGEEPTPQYLAELQEVVEKNNVKIVFSEPQFSNETLKPFAEDIGLKIFILDPVGGTDERQTYIDLMKYNTDTLKEALK